MEARERMCSHVWMPATPGSGADGDSTRGDRKLHFKRSVLTVCPAGTEKCCFCLEPAFLSTGSSPDFYLCPPSAAWLRGRHRHKSSARHYPVPGSCGTEMLLLQTRLEQGCHTWSASAHQTGLTLRTQPQAIEKVGQIDGQGVS